VTTVQLVIIVEEDQSLKPGMLTRNWPTRTRTRTWPPRTRTRTRPRHNFHQCSLPIFIIFLFLPHLHVC